MINFQGILFDLDGTLLDTAPDLGNALNHVLALHNISPCSSSQYRPVASDGAKGLLQLGFGKRFEQIDYELARTQLLDYYYGHICIETRPFDGVLAFLNRLNNASVPWGIVTNKPGWLTRSLLKHIPVMDNCECIVSGDTFEKSKPHPQPLLEAAKILKLSPQRTLYVGDAARDIEAAHAANMRSVAAIYGYLHNPNDAKEWQAEFEINHIQELERLR